MIGETILFFCMSDYDNDYDVFLYSFYKHQFNYNQFYLTQQQIPKMNARVA